MMEEQRILLLPVCRSGILDLCDLHSGQINARKSQSQSWEGSGTNILSIKQKLVIEVAVVSRKAGYSY